MAIHDEVFVRSVFVLADARFNQWSVFQAWKPKFNVGSDIADGFLRRRAISRGRIEFIAACVIGRLESAPLITRDAVIEMRGAMIDPGRHVSFRITRVAGGYAKEKYLL